MVLNSKPKILVTSLGVIEALSIIKKTLNWFDQCKSQNSVVLRDDFKHSILWNICF